MGRPNGRDNVRKPSLNKRIIIVSLSINENLSPHKCWNDRLLDRSRETSDRYNVPIDPKNTKPKSGSGECGKFAEVLNGECRMLRRDKLKLRRLRFSDILSGLPQSSFVAMIAVRGIGSCD
jgi:hypothetical protein